MRHHNCWRWQAVAESIGVIRTKRLLYHTCVVVIPCLELIARYNKLITEKTLLSMRNHFLSPALDNTVAGIGLEGNAY